MQSTYVVLRSTSVLSKWHWLHDVLDDLDQGARPDLVLIKSPVVWLVA